MNYSLHIGIDYSGARTADARLSGLQVYAARKELPSAVLPPAASAKHVRNWTRREVANWLLDIIGSGERVIVGIDHGFSFPINYFKRYQLQSWDVFLEDFVSHWPTHEPETTVDCIRHSKEHPPQRIGSSRDLRLTERWSSSAKSVFQFDVQGSVAKSTHAGLPWLWYLRNNLEDQIHFWPFDGWHVPEKKSLIAEVYPSILKNRYTREDRSPDQQDAYAIARWLTDLDERKLLDRYVNPPLTKQEIEIANLEGWILGIS